MWSNWIVKWHVDSFCSEEKTMKESNKLGEKNGLTIKMTILSKIFKNSSSTDNRHRDCPKEKNLSNLSSSYTHNGQQEYGRIFNLTSCLVWVEMKNLLSLYTLIFLSVILQFY